MKPSASRRRPATAQTTALIVTLVSLAAHALVLVLVQVSGSSGERPGADDRAAEADATATAALEPLPRSCVGDVTLAQSARLLYCASPLSAGQCIADAAAELDTGLAGCERQDEAVRVSMLDHEQIEKLEAKPLMDMLAPEEQQAFEQQQKQEVAQKQKAVQKQQQKPPMQKAQIIETAKPEVEVEPERARYISEYDTRVEKETVARGSVEEDMVERPGPKELPSKEDFTREPGAKEPTPPDQIARENTDRDEPPSEGELTMRRPGPREVRRPQEEQIAGTRSGARPDRDGPGPQPKKGNARVDQREIEATELPGQDGRGNDGGKKKVPNLRPSEDVLARAVGGGSVDHVEGVAEGERTLLNSKGWKHANFFNRLKRQVAQNWHPARTYRRRDPQGNVYGNKDRRTVVRVSLEPSGKLRDVIIVKKSGVDFLDDEAVRAFRAAQPFPNPPEALVDQKTRLITFTFGFHFEVGNRSPWKVIKYR